MDTSYIIKSAIICILFSNLSHPIFNYTYLGGLIMNPTSQVLHLFYVAVMLVGAFTVGILSRNPKHVPKIDYFIAFFIPIWSALAYMSMAFGQGILEISDQITFYARYLDWIITTPLLLISLGLAGMYYIMTDKVLLLSLVASDIVMVLCGLIADLSVGSLRYIWYFIGVIGFFASLYIIWFPLKAIATTQTRELSQTYTVLATYLTVFWFGYPIGWILGPSGLSIVSQQIDTYIFIFLPIFSKVGFSLLSLYKLRQLEPKESLF